MFSVFVTRTGKTHKAIQIEPIYNALGGNKTLELLALHALNGADNTGSFAGKAKISF